MITIHYLRDKPIHKHDCDKCTFCGGFENFDFWYCDVENPPTVIVRYGENGDYGSGICFAVDQLRNGTHNDSSRLPYGYALLAAISKGLLSPSHAAAAVPSPHVDELITAKLIREEYASFIAPKIGNYYTVIMGAFTGESGKLLPGIERGLYHLKVKDSRLLVTAAQLRPAK